MIQEEVHADLEMLVPSGKICKVANEALRGELEMIRRKRSVEKILSAKRNGKPLSNAEILAILSEVRESH